MARIMSFKKYFALCNGVYKWIPLFKVGILALKYWILFDSFLIRKMSKMQIQCLVHANLHSILSLVFTDMKFVKIFNTSVFPKDVKFTPRARKLHHFKSENMSFLFTEFTYSTTFIHAKNMILPEGKWFYASTVCNVSEKFHAWDFSHS